MMDKKKIVAKIEKIKLEACHNCGALPGEVHRQGCDVERCSVCGGQRLQEHLEGNLCKGHDPAFARWTGFWPGGLEADTLGIDMNDFNILGLDKILYVKPELKNEMSVQEINKSVYSKKGNPFGTHQWADKSLNCISGCGNGCLYCYAREMAVRFGQILPGHWLNERVRDKDLDKKIKKYSKPVMFPSSHDIRPEHLEENMIMLKHILEAENDVLLVTKPHLECIKEICSRFKTYLSHILFRFTIGSADDEVLKFWEPNAPGFKERLESLKWAYKKGFQTSISCEPMLDNNIDEVIKKVSPYVTETIWLGKANHLIGKKGRGRLEFNNVATPEVIGRAEELIQWQSDENIIDLFRRHEHNPMIRWKESIERVVEKMN